jgi:hypothetical protein
MNLSSLSDSRRSVSVFFPSRTMFPNRGDRLWTIFVDGPPNASLAKIARKTNNGNNGANDIFCL